jgi:hypothetical protein
MTWPGTHTRRSQPSEVVPTRPLRPAPRPLNPAGPDYLAVEHAEIYVGRSRHGAVVWLWFLS